MHVACRLGRTLGELDLELDELALWIAYFDEHDVEERRRDFHAARQIATMVQLKGGRVTVQDLLVMKQPPQPPTKPEDVWQRLKNWVLSCGGKIRKKGSKK
jgi:hypothetical protein